MAVTYPANKAHPSGSGRLDGLDLARFVALVGMVIVNFKIVMITPQLDTPETVGGAAHLIASALEGRAAATFVVLAGLGLGLAYKRVAGAPLIAVTLKRAAFLMVVGLLNSLIFDADILHYYAVYFALGVFCLPLSRPALTAMIAALTLGFVLLVFALDYDAGWNWDTLSYTGFWTVTGFVRNLFFNGWHPVVPWLAFLLLGITLAKHDLTEPRTHTLMICLGFTLWVGAELVSRLVLGMLGPDWIELLDLVGTAPVPPGPFYMLAGCGAATFTIGLCLKLSPVLRRVGIVQMVAPAGRQTLTLYVAHILLGMGTLEAVGMLGGQSAVAALWAALIFCAAAALYAWLWSRFAKRGPMEMLMRRLAG